MSVDRQAELAFLNSMLGELDADLRQTRLATKEVRRAVSSF
jgi:hypothetical protein